MRARTLAFAALSLVGCGIPSGEMVVYTVDSPELASASVSAEGIWESGPWTGTPWIPFPGRITMQLEHTLGRTPRVVLVYLAFDDEGTDPALAAGDLARVADVTDTTVTVHNDTSATFFVRVVAF
jgi:hypothetical protein